MFSFRTFQLIIANFEHFNYYKNMKKEERQNAIIQLLTQNDIVRVSTISKKFNITLMTARRDLSELEKKNVLIRTHGGAILKEKQIYDTSTSVYKRLKLHSENKQAIAKKAILQIKPNDHLFIGSGSTIELFTEEIPENIPLIVVTNSINVVLRLSHKKNIKIYTVGGELRKKSMTMTGPPAIDDLKRFQLNKAFIGINSIDSHGKIYTSTVVENQLLEYISTSIPQVYVLADVFKLNRKDLINVNFRFNYTLITDKIPIQLKKNYLEYGITIL